MWAEVVQGFANTGLAIIQYKAVATHSLPAAAGPPPQAGRCSALPAKLSRECSNILNNVVLANLADFD